VGTSKCTYHPIFLSGQSVGRTIVDDVQTSQTPPS